MPAMKPGLNPSWDWESRPHSPQDMENIEAGRLNLLAMDMSGWRSLCRISSSLAGDEDTLSFKELGSENTGLICLTGGRQSTLTKLVASRQRQLAEGWISHLSELFPGRLYIELQNHAPEDVELCVSLATLAHRLRLPIVATHDIHYLSPEDAHLQQVQTAIRLIRPLKELDASVTAPPRADFISPQEMAERMPNFPRALEATLEIAERCQLELPLGRPHFPDLSLPAGMTTQELMRQKALDGARRLYGQITPELQARLEHELSVIGEYGYSSLFLIVEEILNFARQEGIPFSSRGSAASSLVAHCLGITSPDPIRLNLYFERFLNPCPGNPSRY